MKFLYFIALGLLGVVLRSSYTEGLRVVAIGDAGDDSDSGMERQDEIALVMSQWCADKSCDFIINAGDNFYENGVTSVDDPRFNTSWLWVYDKPNIDDLVWYQCLGNHDYGIVGDQELYQVEYGISEPRWYLPWLWYDFTITEPDYSIHFIVLDAMSILLHKYDWEAELDWYNTTLSESTADWKVVMEHYPPYSAGNYAPGAIVHRNELVPLAEQYGVDLFVAGHDHNLQHISKIDNPDIDYIVTAGGGRRLYDVDERGNQTLYEMGFLSRYFGHHTGFVMLDFSATSIRADYVDDQGATRYSFTRTKAGKDETFDL